MSKHSFFIYLTGYARHIGISSIIHFFRNPTFYNHSRETATDHHDKDGVSNITVNLDRPAKAFQVHASVNYVDATLPEADRRNGTDRRAQDERRTGEDRRAQTAFRWLGRRKAKYDRRSGREQRAGIDRRKMDLFQERTHLQEAAKKAEEAKKQNPAANTTTSGTKRTLQPLQDAAPASSLAPIRDNQGRMVAGILRKNENYQVKLNPEGNVNQVDLYLDAADGMIQVQGMDSECLTLGGIDLTKHMVHILCNGHAHLHVSRHSRGHVKLCSENDGEKSVVTVSVSGLGNAMEHYWGNTFRLGQMILEIDQTRRVEIVNEAGKHCRISGPAGPGNLKAFVNPEGSTNTQTAAM